MTKPVKPSAIARFVVKHAERSCMFLRKRALHSLGLEAKLRKISLPALLGQLNLNT